MKRLIVILASCMKFERSHNNFESQFGPRLSIISSLLHPHDGISKGIIHLRAFMVGRGRQNAKTYEAEGT